MVSRKVIYSGWVQGVGFRYTASRIAGGYRVQGYVKNLPDGTVELLAQGDLEEVTCFLGALEQRLAENIHSKKMSEVKLAPYGSFRVLH